MNKTRLEEIKEAAEIYNTFTSTKGVVSAFISGAVWADENKESWIDVDEELPYERPKLVIDCNTFKITPWIFTHYLNGTFGITKMICENDTWRWLSPDMVFMINPKYWMPIPELPK